MLTDALIIILIFVVPVLLFYYKILEHKYRMKALTGILISVLAILFFEGWTFEMLGIDFSNIFAFFVPYAIFTLIILVVIFIMVKIKGLKPDRSKEKFIHLHVLFLPVSFIQELLYRGFLMPKLYFILGNFYWVILVNGLLFMILHIIYSNDLSSLILIFFAGLGFASMYYFYPNLIMVSLAHSVLNYTVILYGAFFKENKDRKKIIKEIYDYVHNK